jgi:hypothetical protein
MPDASILPVAQLPELAELRRSNQQFLGKNSVIQNGRTVEHSSRSISSSWLIGAAQTQSREQLNLKA